MKSHPTIEASEFRDTVQAGGRRGESFYAAADGSLGPVGGTQQLEQKVSWPGQDESEPGMTIQGQPFRIGRSVLAAANSAKEPPETTSDDKDIPWIVAEPYTEEMIKHGFLGQPRVDIDQTSTPHQVFYPLSVSDGTASEQAGAPADNMVMEY